MGLPFIKRTQRIDLQSWRMVTGKSQRLPESINHQQLLSIHIRAWHTKRLNSKLMKLPIAATLRALMTKHWPDIPESFGPVI